MHLTNCNRWVVFLVILFFLWASSCATTEKYNPPERKKTEAYTIELEPESVEPYETIALEEGAPAPDDGVWFDTESARRLLEMKTRYEGLRAEVGVQNQIAEARAKQIDLLHEANDLQKAANVELVNEIERKKKWAKWEQWGSFFGGILLMIGSRYMWK